MQTTRIVLSGTQTDYGQNVVIPWAEAHFGDSVIVENEDYRAVLVVENSLFPEVYQQLVKNEPQDTYQFVIPLDAPEHAGELYMGKAFSANQAELQRATAATVLLPAQPKELIAYRNEEARRRARP
ncbi:MAG: hypothetical protein WCO23_02535 [bacterium]